MPRETGAEPPCRVRAHQCQALWYLQRPSCQTSSALALSKAGGFVSPYVFYLDRENVHLLPTWLKRKFNLFPKSLYIGPFCKE